MTYRVLALTVAAGVSLNSAALAKSHCRAGEIYYHSKHTCLAKKVAIDRGIYHDRHHTTAEADGTTIVHQSARARAAAAPAAAVPVPPVRLAHMATASGPTRNENDDNIGSNASPAPEMSRQSMSPYGALYR